MDKKTSTGEIANFIIAIRDEIPTSLRQRFEQVILLLAKAPPEVKYATIAKMDKLLMSPEKSLQLLTRGLDQLVSDLPVEIQSYDRSASNADPQKIIRLRKR